MATVCRWWLLLCACAVSASDFPPNPQTDFADCRRPKPSLVCNLDEVVSFEDGEKLERLTADLRQVSQCLCLNCAPEKGVSIAVFVAHDVRNRTALPPSWKGNDFAQWIREKWKLGNCDDEIVIVLITNQNLSGYSMGPRMQRLLPRSTVDQIFEDCEVHFRYGYYTQGLESIINSLSDVLLRLQQQREEAEGPGASNLNLALGIALGVCVFLILMLAAVILLWREAAKRGRARRKPKPHDKRKDKDYHACMLNDQIGESDTESDSDILYESVANGKDYKASLRFKRQLSDVQEEFEDVPQGEDNDISVGVQNSNRSHEVTEL